MRRGLCAAAVISLFVVAAEGLRAQAKQRVRFARGASSAMLKGTVRGYGYRDYIIGAAAGRTISVKLSSSNMFSVFSIFRPDRDSLGGASQTDNFTGELPASGDYVVRVGMMRAEARRPGSVSHYTLTVSIK